MKKILDIENLRKEKLIRKYCRHLKSGYSKESFPDEESKVIEDYANEIDKNNGNENLKRLIERSKREGMYFWERVGIKGLTDEKIKLNGGVWTFIMKSRFGLNQKLAKQKLKDEVIKVNLDFENGNKEIND